jgi:dUTP pyrophosphatase
MTLRVRRLHPDARLPHRAHPDDAGLDLHALEPIRLAPGERALVRTGIAIELPPGHAGWVVPRSGLARTLGLTVVNAPGLVDAGYRGEVGVLLLNTDAGAVAELDAGERIAQLVVMAVAAPELVEVDELGATARGAGGFGSTGTR